MTSRRRKVDWVEVVEYVLAAFAVLVVVGLFLWGMVRLYQTSSVEYQRERQIERVREDIEFREQCENAGGQINNSGRGRPICELKEWG